MSTIFFINLKNIFYIQALFRTIFRDIIIINNILSIGGASYFRHHQIKKLLNNNSIYSFIDINLEINKKELVKNTNFRLFCIIYSL